MVDSPEYKFDIAFSFLADDEHIATALADRLQDRFRVFVYSRQQRELAGKDGEVEFNRVFSKESRLVVVLHRAKWGTTPWTRIEEQAIRDRAYANGYDFDKFVPLDSASAIPNWLPKTQLWIGFSRWGIDSTADIIEARASELGASVREEDVFDRAARLQRAVEFQERRKKYLESFDGVNAASTEVAALRELFADCVAGINAKLSGIECVVKGDMRRIVIVGLEPGMSIEWKCRYSNSLMESSLEAKIWSGHPPMPGGYQFEEPEITLTRVFELDVSTDMTLIWRSKGNKEKVYSSKSLSEFLLKLYIDAAEKMRRQS